MSAFRIATSNLAGVELTSTRTVAGEVYDERNLVVASRFPVIRSRQIRTEYVAAPQ
jgi:hypothetical protein